MSDAVINLAYLVSSVLFIFGLKGLTHPRTAVRGNLMGASGMLLAVLATLLSRSILGFAWIFVGIVIGAAIGALLTTRVQMTAMPQMVALLNGFGGIASVLVAGAALGEYAVLVGQGLTAPLEGLSQLQFSIATAASSLIGAVTFWGSLVAFGKLEGLTAEQLQQRLATIVGRLPLPAQTSKRALVSEGAAQPAEVQDGNQVVIAQSTASSSSDGVLQRIGPIAKQWNQNLTKKTQLKGVLLGACVLLAIILIFNPTSVLTYWLIALIASILGWYLVMPIGGADMPVVIALLNSYSGLAAAATGFVLGNSVLIITGSLVGASGIILTTIMCRAMNRSLTNVLFGVWVPEGAGGTADEVYGGKIKASSPEELAMLLDGVRRVVIVPGYGMAVAQAQHAVRDFTNLLESRGVEVEFAIHPVAGRMPGHMNVLLAEADIPYDKLKEMDEINPTFEQTDVAIVIGANDVTNPLARTDPKSPIAGMPILDVSHARSVVVIKRSLSPGFAGIPNPLFAADNTLMLFSDAKKGMLDLVAAVKEQ